MTEATTTLTRAVFALLLAVAGSVVPSPSGGFFLNVVATLVALPPTIFGTGRARLGGAMACVLSAALAVEAFPAMQEDQAAYVERAKRKDRGTGAPAPEMTPGGSPTK